MHELRFAKLEMDRKAAELEETLKGYSSWHSYPSPYAFGHRGVYDILDGEVLIEEKIDGSQFSFGFYDGKLKMRSRGQEINPYITEGMFSKGIAYVRSIEDKLTEGYMYSGEYLQKPRHNILPYSRIPNNHTMIFDIRKGNEDYLSREEKEIESIRLGFEITPVLYNGKASFDQLEDFMKSESILGGPIEGIVIKNYSKLCPNKKVAMAKIVSSKFKEKHAKEWKQDNPGQKDIRTMLCEKYRSEARWAKAVMHLKEEGKLLGEPKDIGLLVKEVQEDIFKDSVEEIKELLFEWAWPDIKRASIGRLPEWYKAQLSGVEI